MLQSCEEAKKILKDSEPLNPGPWGNHCRLVALCAEKIAAAVGLDENKAYVCGLLHDIGRRFRVRHLGHVTDGYFYMMSLGFDEVAKICLTHSFPCNSIDEYIGNFDITAEELNLLQEKLKSVEFDDYDRLIQLCDSLAGGESIMTIEERMNDVKNRYGFYPKAKWNKNLEIKDYFEEKLGKDIYSVIKKIKLFA
ncbi:MAG: HD domain-containing protein [Spirochaetaceae bacterium]|nr:HD domain-containing protein [Spirochaetaceae bacterium]